MDDLNKRCELLAYKVELEMMLSSNKAREGLGLKPLYGPDDFDNLRVKVQALAYEDEQPNLVVHKEDILHCGLTEAQWQRVIDEKFLVEVRDSENDDWFFPVLLTEFDREEKVPFLSTNDCYWKYCRPYRVPGIRQPWFGGECPVKHYSVVIVKDRDGDVDGGSTDDFEWEWSGDGGDIVEFVYYPEAK